MEKGCNRDWSWIGYNNNTYLWKKEYDGDKFLIGYSNKYIFVEKEYDRDKFSVKIFT